MKPDMKARLSLLHKTEADWNKLPNFIPYAGELIIFDADQQYDYVRLKLGDGKTKLSDLPFFIDAAITTYVYKHQYDEEIDCGRISKAKNK